MKTKKVFPIIELEKWDFKFSLTLIGKRRKSEKHFIPVSFNFGGFKLYNFAFGAILENFGINLYLFYFYLYLGLEFNKNSISEVITDTYTGKRSNFLNFKIIKYEYED